MPKLFKSIKLQLLRLKRKKRLFGQNFNWRILILPGSVLLGLVLIGLAIFWISKLPPRAPNFKKSSSEIYSYEAKNKNFQTSLGLKDQSPIISFGTSENHLVTLLYQTDQKTNPQLNANGKNLTYTEIEAGIDLKYQTLANGIKEEIILNQVRQKEANIGVFLFDANLQGAYLKESVKGLATPIFYDENDNYLFHFEKPFAIDAAGNRTDNVSLQIEDKANSKITSVRRDTNSETPYLVRMTVDENWLNDPARVYPITIDPTIVHDESSEFSPGQLNRVKDTGSGSSPVLESYYQELAADEYTLGLWHFNELSGNALDSSGNSLTGTPTGTTVVAGLLNNARSFNGSSDYITITNALLDRSDTMPLSIASWVKFNSLGTVEVIADKGQTNYFRYTLKKNADNKAVISIVKNGFAGVDAIGSTTLNINTWYHLAGTFDGTTNANSIRIYVNGVLDGSATYNQTGAIANTGTLRIGATYLGTGGFLNGLIDELIISGRLFSEEEIKTAASRRPYSTYTSDVIDLTDVKVWDDLSWLTNGIATGDGETLYSTDGLLAQWNLNETSGTTAANNAGSCGTACNGTLTNFSSTTLATGGTITYSGGYTIHTFTSSGTFTPSTSINVETLVVAGGGGGGGSISSRGGGGGGGGGGMISSTIGVTAQAYTVTVGNGGGGGSGVRGASGDNSVFSTITATGGGGGGDGVPTNSVGLNGGSGGGAGYNAYSTSTAGTGTAGQGNNGGQNGATSGAGGGGGGGAGGAGNAPTNSPLHNGGIGGAGLASSISGTSVTYAAGGNGGGATVAAGGANTGNGGSGTYAQNNGGVGYNGGSGVVVIRYRTPGAGSGWTSDNKRWGAGALMFDGTDDYISLSDNDAYTLGNGVTDTPFTIEMWANLSGASEMLMVKRDSTSANPIQEWQFGIGSDYDLSFYIWDQTTGGRIARVSPSIQGVTQGKWAHYVVTYDGSKTDSGIKIYLNGVRVDSTSSNSGTYTATRNTSTPVYIGAYINSSGVIDRFANGSIDSTRIYSRALTASEILSNYNSSRIEFQTRVGATTDVNDGTWEAWSPSSTVETIIDNMDSNTEYNYNTKLLLHFNGTDTATTFTDHELVPKTITPTDNAQIDTAQSKFGGSSALFDGTGDYLTIPDNNDFAFGSEDFTIDFWMRLNALPASGSYTFYSQFADDLNFSRIALWNNGSSQYAIQFQEYIAGSSTAASFMSTYDNSWQANTWYHIALVRSGNSWNIYRDGVSIASKTSSTTLTNLAGDAFIGKYKSGYYMNGWLDEYRITKGKAIWTSNFTPPTTSYKNPSRLNNSTDSVIKMEGAASEKIITGRPEVDGSTVGLWHLDETSGTGAYLKDSTVNANNGTPTGTTVIDGISGKARSFNGSSYITVPDSDSLDLTGDFTISGWVMRTTGANGTLVSKTVATTTGGYSVLWGTQGEVYCRTNNGTTYTDSYTSTGVLTSSTGWTHIVAVKKGTSCRIFINGIDKTSTAHSHTNPVANALPLRIGARTDLGAEFAVGQIDEVSISNIAYSTDQIAEAYRMGRDHRISRTISSTNLSSINKLPFYVAADRPGTYLEAVIGESPFTNYEPDANTVGLWHFDEKIESVYPKSCLSLLKDGITTSGIYTVDPDGTGASAPFSTYCDMVTNGGGWMLLDNFVSSLAGDVDPYGAAIGYSNIKGAADLTTAGYTTYLTHFENTGYTRTAGYLQMFYNSAPVGYIQKNLPTFANEVYVKWGNWVTGTADLLIGGAIVQTLTANYGPATYQAAYTPGATIKFQENGLLWVGEIWVRNTNDEADPVAKDSSGKNNHGISRETSSTTGKMGGARSFTTSTNNISTNTTSLGFTNAITAEAWVYPTGTDSSWNWIVSQWPNPNGTGAVFNLSYSTTYNLHFHVQSCTAGLHNETSTRTLSLNKWNYVAATYNGATGAINLYINGVLDKTSSGTAGTICNASLPITFGKSPFDAIESLKGSIDEVRISNVVRSADEIRQAYEIGSRSHQITIDFGAKLDAGNLIANVNDKSFTVDATYYGLNSKGSNLYLGDKIIIKENVDGTEYIAQGTVNGVTTGTGAITVSAWDGGSTFPSSGFTANASVFKWQREYLDITGSLASHRDAITDLTFRLTNGNEGRTIWLDDLESTTGYLNNPLGSTITNSIGNRYFQYRAILSSNDSNVSASFSNVSLDYVSNLPPEVPTLDLPLNTVSGQSLLPILKTTATDDEGNYLRYKIELCTNAAMNLGCQTFTQGATYPQTGWTGQNAALSGSNYLAYASGTQATYTLQTALEPNTTYYWRSYAIDPIGSNTWGETQAAPYSFTTSVAPSAPTDLYTENVTNPTGIADVTPEFSAVHHDSDGNSAVHYEIEVNTAADFAGTIMWDSGQQSMTSTADGTRSPQISYAGTALPLNGATYYWRIRFWDNLTTMGTWSAVQTFAMNTPPNIPTLDTPINMATNQNFQIALQTTATDDEGNYLRYKIELCTNAAMNLGCQTFTQGATYPQTGWTGQNAALSGSNYLAYASGTQATYTLQTALEPNTTYYWRSYAIDPIGSNTWGETQAAPYSFTTLATPVAASNCYIQENIDRTQFLLVWTDNATNEDFYEVQRSVDGGAWTALQTALSPNTINLLDTSVTSGHTYQYRVAPYFTGPYYASWCTASTLNLGSGLFNLEGINASGLHFN